MNEQTKALLIRILRTLQIVLGIALAVASVWEATLPFNPEDIQKLITLLLSLLGASFILGDGVYRLRKKD